MAPCDRDFDENESSGEQPEEHFDLTRRQFLTTTGLVTAGMAAGFPNVAEAADGPDGEKPSLVPIIVTINKQRQTLTVDTRTSLLDLLRERLDLTGSKKGCDQGQCGACTVLMDGRRINSCLTLAVAAQGAEITTVEGLGNEQHLSEVQQSFLDHDGFQCGYCTPGQICSATALRDEINRGELSMVSFETGHTAKPAISDAEIRERMSGNICRCGAYPNIVAAVRALTANGGVA
jgi:xanthine dehydrogenase YagT iron-sulfur-binding subunit